MAWAPILTRDNGIPSPDSRDTPMRKGEEAQASGKLLKKRRASMAVWSIKYNDDGTCAILLNLTFGLRTGQTLKRAKIPLRVVGSQNDVVIDSWDPYESEVIQVDNRARESWLHAAFSLLSALLCGKLNQTAAREKGQSIPSYVTQSVFPMGPSTVILSFNGSGALEPSFPTNVHFLLRIKQISPYTRTDCPFAFRLILSHEFEVEITRKWLPNLWYRSAKLFRLKKPRGWSIPIWQDFSHFPGDGVVGCGLDDAWARARGAGIVKGSSKPMRELSVHGGEILQSAEIQEVSRRCTAPSTTQQLQIPPVPVTADGDELLSAQSELTAARQELAEYRSGGYW